MNQLHLSRSLGTITSSAFQRSYLEQAVLSLECAQNCQFSSTPPIPGERSDIHTSSAGSFSTSQQPNFAHLAGANCIAIDDNSARYLVSGGADANIHLWDLELCSSNNTFLNYQPVASLHRFSLSSHTHALTSLSIYPFDPQPTTLLSTSYDKTLKLTSITPSSLTPIHTFSLDFAPYTHSLCPIPSFSSALVGVGTAHPAIRLFDLRSGLGIHSLPGHNGAIYSLSWSPRHSHILASGGSDGRVLIFDIRRANAALASLDLDDAIGVVGEPASLGTGSRKALDWNTRAHNGAVTGLLWTANGESIVSAGHDQRIRVWDAVTGRSDLVHFGPRIRNSRVGELKPLLSPLGCGRPGREMLLWANDDGRGDIYVHSLREGNMIKIMRTHGVNRGKSQKGDSGSVGRLTSGGRINGMLWRRNADQGGGLEMYSAHGDGRICAWQPRLGGERQSDELETAAFEAAETSRKRKRDLIGDLLHGLTEMPINHP